MCTAGETMAKLLTMTNILQFSSETGAFISKNHFPSSKQFFWFLILSFKKLGQRGLKLEHFLEAK